MAEQPWHEARLIPTSGINGAEEQERRATSALLAVMAAAKPCVCARLEELYLEARRAGSGGTSRRCTRLRSSASLRSHWGAPSEGWSPPVAPLGGEVARASQRTESLRPSFLTAAFSGELVA